MKTLNVLGATLSLERPPYIHSYDKIVVDGVSKTVEDFIGKRFTADSHLLKADSLHYYNTKMSIPAAEYNSAGGYLPFIIAKLSNMVLPCSIYVGQSEIPPFNTFTVATADSSIAASLIQSAGIQPKGVSTSSRDKYD